MFINKTRCSFHLDFSSLGPLVVRGDFKFEFEFELEGSSDNRLFLCGVLLMRFSELLSFSREFLLSELLSAVSSIFLSLFSDDSAAPPEGSSILAEAEVAEFSLFSFVEGPGMRKKEVSISKSLKIYHLYLNDM